MESHLLLENQKQTEEAFSVTLPLEMIFLIINFSANHFTLRDLLPMRTISKTFKTEIDTELKSIIQNGSPEKIVQLFYEAPMGMALFFVQWYRLTAAYQNTIAADYGDAELKLDSHDIFTFTSAILCIDDIYKINNELLETYNAALLLKSQEILTARCEIKNKIMKELSQLCTQAPHNLSKIMCQFNVKLLLEFLLQDEDFAKGDLASHLEKHEESKWDMKTKVKIFPKIVDYFYGQYQQNKANFLPLIAVHHQNRAADEFYKYLFYALEIVSQAIFMRTESGALQAMNASIVMHNKVRSMNPVKDRYVNLSGLHANKIFDLMGMSPPLDLSNCNLENAMFVATDLNNFILTRACLKNANVDDVYDSRSKSKAKTGDGLSACFQNSNRLFDSAFDLTQEDFKSFDHFRNRLDQLYKIRKLKDTSALRAKICARLIAWASTEEVNVDLASKCLEFAAQHPFFNASRLKAKAKHVCEHLHFKQMFLSKEQKAIKATLKSLQAKQKVLPTTAFAG